MRIRALVSFSGLISMGKGQVMECNNEVALQDLLKVGYVEEINSKEDPTKEPTGTSEEPASIPEEPSGTTEESTSTPEEPASIPEEPSGTTEESTSTPEESTSTPEESAVTPATEPVEEANEEKGVDSRETKRNNKK